MSKYEKQYKPNSSKRKNKKRSGPVLIPGYEKVHREDLTPAQRDVEKLFDRWWNGGKYTKQILRVGGGAGSGKAQPVTTKIPTPQGFRAMGDLRVGDYVYNVEGVPVKVLGVYPQGERPVYRVTFEDGRYTDCNAEHLWFVYVNNGTESTLSVREMANVFKYIGEDNAVHYRYRVPLPVAPEHRRTGPYLGVLPEAAATALEAFEPETVRRLMMTYLNEPIELRFRFLRRIMKDQIEMRAGDIDDKYSRYVCVYTTRKKYVAQCIQNLAWSLGFYAQLNEEKHFLDYSYEVRVRFPRAYPGYSLFSDVDEFMEHFTPERREKLISRERSLAITSITLLAKPVEQVCIYVDDIRHLYITSGFIATHNTYFLKYLLDKYRFDQSECYVMSYTGQSVNVLRANGVMAYTIHASITHPREEPILDKKGQPIYKHGIQLTRTRFIPLSKLPDSVKLVIVDEASFLPKEFEDRLRRYGVPIFEIGDPLQLPPVLAEQCFRMETLNYFMEGVMRQNKDSELYDFLTHLRQMKNIDTTRYHNDVLFLYAQPTVEQTFMRFLPFFKNADVTIVSNNKQRQVVTDLYRKYVLKTSSPYPIKGERVISRKNNYDMPICDQYFLSNGTQGVCMETVGRSEVNTKQKTFTMNFKPDVAQGTEEYYDNMLCDSIFLHKPFGMEDPLAYKRPGEKIEFAHAITAHLSQGAQYDTVVFMDSLLSDADYAARLRYTACSRARKRLIYIIPYCKRYPGYFALRHVEKNYEDWSD